jgi:hypothetical protein
MGGGAMADESDALVASCGRIRLCKHQRVIVYNILKGTIRHFFANARASEPRADCVLPG